MIDSLYGAADIGCWYGLVPGPIRVLCARQARAAAVVFTPRSSGQPIGWRRQHQELCAETAKKTPKLGKRKLLNFFKMYDLYRGVPCES